MLFFVLVIEMFQTNEQHGHCLVQIRSTNLAAIYTQLSHRH